MNFEFYSPYFLFLFLLLIPLLIGDFSREKKYTGIRVPGIKGMTVAGRFSLIQKVLKFSKYLILSSLIIALARPRTYTVTDDRDDAQGIDIILAADISPSMLAKDFDPDRITALKKIAKDFIRKRTSDRIGLVEFWGEAIAKVPLTTDYQVLYDELDAITPNFDEYPGTAMGTGLSVAVNHLKNSKSKSKIVILMSDGENNVLNAIDPAVAADLAKSYGIKVYTIGIGTNGIAAFPVPSIFGIEYAEQEVQIDEATLSEIASKTGGKYYRATSNESLQNVYNEINSLEKSTVKTNKIYNYEEYFRVFLWAALFVLLIDAVMRWRIFRIFN
jgi:Ca-activated chloride channel family protein